MGNNICDILHEDAVKRVKSYLVNDEEILKYVQLNKIFANFSRIKILLALEKEKLCVCDIGHILNMEQSAVSHQLRILKENNLIVPIKDGKVIFYTLRDKEIINYIRRTLWFWIY